MKKIITSLSLFCILSITNSILASQLATISTTRDNSIIQSATGVLANSLGQIYVGRTNQDANGTAVTSIRRGLVYFDIASNIPTNAIIDSVRLSMYFAKTSGAGTSVMLHKVLSNWGEGTSAFSGGSGATAGTNDVTWLHSFYNSVFWSTAGGDFDAVVSATSYAGTGSGTGIESYGLKIWGASTQMNNDVKSWLSSPSTNYGWLLQGDESKGQTAKQFYSKDCGATLGTPPPASQIPTLYVYYTVPSLAVASLNETFQYNANSTSTINVTANANWTVSTTASWLNVSQDVSSGDGSITITATANTIVASRVDTVTISMTGVTSKKIIITQTGIPPSLALSATSATIKDTANSTTTMNVIANTIWTATTNASWLSVSQSVSSGDGAVTITATANTASTIRVDTVIVSMANIPSQKIIITQYAAPVHSTLVSILTTRDNTIVQTVDGSMGNSLGLIYIGSVGKSSNIIRRGLVYFDIANNVPANAIIDSVRLIMTFNTPASLTMMMYKATTNWGEGTSNATGGMGVAATTNDVTWLHSFYNTKLWTTPGGDFDATLVASKAITNTSTTLSLSTELMKTEVQSWLTLPISNFGWLLRASDESMASAGVMSKLYSKETGTGSQIPTLKVYYSLPSIAISASSASLNDTANSTASLTLTTNTSWTATKTVSWLTLNAGSGTGNATISFTATANTGLTSRTDTLIITVSGNSPQKVIVTQTAPATYTWNGTNTWLHSANWNPVSVPTNGSNIIVASGELTIDQDVNLANIIVNAGAKLSLNSAKTLSVMADFTIKSDATGTGTFVENGTLTVNGKTSVEQYLKSGRNWYLSSPVSSAQSSIVKSDATNKLWYYNEPIASWDEIVNSTTSLQVMSGYIAKVSADSVISFTGGIFNTGSQTANVTRTGTTNDKRGFNLVGNPYPSYVNWESANKTNLIPTIWYRTKNIANAYVFDTYNDTNHIGTNNNGSGAITQFIPPMQAVWVKVDADGNTGHVTFDNSMRSHQSNNSLKANNIPDFIRLQVANGLNSDEAILVFNANASNGYDAFDSPKLFSDDSNFNVPQLYTVADSEKVVINGLESVESVPSIALGFKTKSTGTFTISAKEISGLSSVPVILEDKLLNKTQDLTKSIPYTFTADSSDNTSRFSLHLKAGTITVNDLLSSSISIYSIDNSILVKTTAENTGTITVYDILGQIVTNSILTGTQTVLTIPTIAGAYFVKVETAKDVVTKKIILN